MAQKWTGSAFGITTKIPKGALRITEGTTQEHVSDNGSGVMLHREFCGTCGSGILEYGVSFPWRGFIGASSEAEG
jgi:hypothetical protein